MLDQNLALVNQPTIYMTVQPVYSAHKYVVYKSIQVVNKALEIIIVMQHGKNSDLLVTIKKNCSEWGAHAG